MTELEVKNNGLVKLLPKRSKVGGKRPGNTTLELGKKRPDPEKEQDPDDSKWAPTDISALDDHQKRTILSWVLRLAVLNIFKNHMYQFGGVTYRQLKGAPIGLRLTSIIARIVMDQWVKMFLVKVSKAGARVHLLAKYVDDVNMIMGMLPLGTRWEDGMLTHSKEKESLDKAENRSGEENTMMCMQAAANSVIVWLEFTMDIPEYHESRTVPILDLQVWIKHPTPEEQEEGLSSDTVMFMFFEKKTASARVLRASSAFTWRNKITTMSMEIFRRMHNTSRQVTADCRANIMRIFIAKLRSSGYNQGACRGLITSGLRYYYRKMRISLEGGPPINQRKEEDTITRKRSKLGASQRWFARRRGGGTKRLTRKIMGGELTLP